MNSVPYWLGSMLLTVGAAQAAEPIQLSPLVALDEVTVYGAPEMLQAGHSALPVLETPIAVQSVSGEVISDQAATSLEAVLRNVSGVTPMYYLGGGYERFIVRGFEQSLATYRNGVQLPFLRFQAADTERVEVLKGPAAAEYGMSDPGGTINIVTKVPQADAYYSLAQTLGSYDERRTTLDATGSLGSDALQYRLSGSYLSSGGFRELTDTKNYFIAPSVSWQPTTSTQVNLSVELDKTKQLYDGGLPALGTGLIDLPIERSFNQAGLGDTYKNRLIDFRVDQKLNANWQLQVGHIDFSNQKDYRSFYVYADLQPGDTVADRYAWFGPEDFDTRSSWAQVSGQFNTGGVEHHLLVGVQHSILTGDAVATDEYVDTINLYTYRPAQSNVDLTQFDTAAVAFTSYQVDRATGIFVQDQLRVTERLNLQASLRHDTIKRELDTAYFSPVEHFARKDSKTSPRLGMLYKLSKSASLYASYAESFGPSFSYEPSALYDPESARQYEAGFKLNALKGRLGTSITVFDLTKSNIATPDPNNPNFNIAIGEARSRGVEFDLQGELSTSLSLLANYAYLDTEITRDFGGNLGHRLPNAPRHQGGAWLRYTFPAKLLPGLSAGGGVSAASQRYGDAANSYGDGGYSRWDVFSAYRFVIGGARVSAQLNVNNVTDERYYTMRARWTNHPAAPRTVVASLTAEF